MSRDDWGGWRMPDRLRQIQARQIGRHSKDGPQQGQEVVSLAAFLIARADIDYLLGVIDRAALVVGPAMTFWKTWEAEERYVSAETVLAAWQAKTALLAACAASGTAEGGDRGG